jgi:hypothetical protein
MESFFLRQLDTDMTSNRIVNKIYGGVTEKLLQSLHFLDLVYNEKYFNLLSRLSTRCK